MPYLILGFRQRLLPCKHNNPWLWKLVFGCIDWICRRKGLDSRKAIDWKPKFFANFLGFFLMFLRRIHWWVFCIALGSLLLLVLLFFLCLYSFLLLLSSWPFLLIVLPIAITDKNKIRYLCNSISWQLYQNKTNLYVEGKFSNYAEELCGRHFFSSRSNYLHAWGIYSTQEFFMTSELEEEKRNYPKGGKERSIPHRNFF